MAMHGADIAQLRSLAAQFDRAADQLETCRMAVGGSVRSSPWQGADAVRFRADWDSAHAGRIAAAASLLRTGAQGLRNNADQQEQASAVDAGAGGGQGAPGSASTGGKPTVPPAGTSPEEVRDWWDSLTEEQRRQLIAKDPVTIGNLNGVPLEDRAAANQLTAQNRLGEIDDELAALGDKPQPNLWTMGQDGGLGYALQLQRWESERDALLQEQRYLQAVTDGRRSLVVYDPAGERIVEMIGNPGAGTREVITYLPGTGASMAGFYEGSTQQVSKYLVQADPSGGTVAFVYKDGPWASWLPWESTSNLNMGHAQAEGAQLADFQRALALEGNFSGAQWNGMAHSAGMTSLSASEVAGAHYDQVLSLGGAMLAPGWQADPGTGYGHYQYGLDAINYANPIGDLPAESSAFTQHVYQPDTFSILGVEFQNEISNHTRVAGDTDNQSALAEMYRNIHSD